VIRSRTRLECLRRKLPHISLPIAFDLVHELLIIRILDNFKICSIDALVAIILVFRDYSSDLKKGGFPAVLRSLPYSMTCSYLSSVAGGTPRYEDASENS